MYSTGSWKLRQFNALVGVGVHSTQVERLSIEIGCGHIDVHLSLRSQAVFSVPGETLAPARGTLRWSGTESARCRAARPTTMASKRRMLIKGLETLDRSTAQPTTDAFTMMKTLVLIAVIGTLDARNVFFVPVPS